MAGILSVLFLTGLASATNIVGLTQDSCGGGAYASCTNIGGNTCCQLISGTQGAVSVQFQDLPGLSNIYGYQNTRDGGECGDRVSEHQASGSACITFAGGDQYAGAAYFPTSSKRSAAASGSECSGSQKADLIGLEDGTEFNLKNLTDTEVQELWSLATAGVAAARIPEKFAAHLL